MSKRVAKKRKRETVREPDRYYLAIAVYTERPHCDSLIPGVTLIAAPTYTSICNYSCPSGVPMEEVRARLDANIRRHPRDQQVSLIILEITAEQADLVHDQEASDPGTLSYSLLLPAVRE
jgi:hypothetical protein